MSRFNHYMNSHFGSCFLLAKGYDPHRQRAVRLYLIPGEVGCVGVTDGVDAWVAPVAADPLGIKLPDLLAKHWAGEDVGFPIVTSDAKKAVATEGKRQRIPLLGRPAPDTASKLPIRATKPRQALIPHHPPATTERAPKARIPLVRR